VAIGQAKEMLETVMKAILGYDGPNSDIDIDGESGVDEIDLRRIGAADLVFDEAKLRWLSGRHIAAMPLDDLVVALQPFLDRDRFPIPDAVLTPPGGARPHPHPPIPHVGRPTPKTQFHPAIFQHNEL
jgi:glutamyl/glutaminyl-tRNA synthetase